MRTPATSHSIFKIARTHLLPTAVSKAGCIHLAKDMAKACAPDIRVNAIAPGLILTEWADRFSPEVIKGWANTTALKRVPTPEDIAATYGKCTLGCNAQQSQSGGTDLF